MSRLPSTILSSWSSSSAAFCVRLPSRRRPRALRGIPRALVDGGRAEGHPAPLALGRVPLARRGIEAQQGELSGKGEGLAGHGQRTMPDPREAGENFRAQLDDRRMR